MKIAHVSFKVPDSFKVGDCKNCPLHDESYFDNHYVKTNTFCKLNASSPFCPIIMEVMLDEF
jgi:hypothetical protein